MRSSLHTSGHFLIHFRKPDYTNSTCCCPMNMKLAFFFNHTSVSRFQFVLIFYFLFFAVIVFNKANMCVCDRLFWRHSTIHMLPQIDYGMSVSLWGTQIFPQREIKLHSLSKRSWENLRTHVALGYGQVRIAFS